MTQPIENITVQVAVDLAEVHRKVDRGVELNRLIKEQEKELEAIKAYLREQAATGAFPATETGTVEIRSEETQNCVQVIPCKDTPGLIKGVDMTSLKSQLTQGQFDLMFREVIVMQPAAAFETAFGAAAKKVQNIVKRYVAWSPNTSQVKFSK